MIILSSHKKPVQQITQEIKDFKGASNLLLDEARVAPNEAVRALNLWQVQDGLWKPRPGRSYYGGAYGGNIDGASEYVKSDGTTELIVVAGGKAYKSQNGGTATEITGAIFTAGKQCYFLQIAGYLYIANGTNPLTRYDGSVLKTYGSVNAPTGVAISAIGGLAAGSFNYYVQVTALNGIGETTGSIEATIGVDKKRDQWTSGAGLQINWNAATPVSDVTRYQIYISDMQGQESLVTSVTATATMIQDLGALTINPYIQPPLQNTTAAPKFKSMCVSNNRIWCTNDANSLYTVYFSGTGVNIGVFSDFYGGGWINLERGGREIPVRVVHYQSGSGEGRATVICKTPEGRGAVWQLQITTATVGTTSFSVPAAVKIVGSSGTESILGVVATNNEIMFPNRRGWFSLAPQQGFYGILRNNEISQKIRNYWRSLTGAALSGIASYYWDGKVIISVPTSAASLGNNRTIILDVERSNWTVDWSFGAKQWLEYTDTLGVTHLLYVSPAGTQLIEVSENTQGDFGAAFETEYQSGRLSVAKYWKNFTRIDKVFLKLGSAKGKIQFEVSGTQANQPFKSLGTATITPKSSSTGMGWDEMGSVNMGDTAGTPASYSDSSDPHFVPIRKKLRDIKYRIYTNSVDADYILQGIIMEGVAVRKSPPSTWKLTPS